MSARDWNDEWIQQTDFILQADLGQGWTAFATTANSNESGKTIDGTTILMLTANSAVAGL